MKTPDGRWMVTYADGPQKVVQKDLPPLQVTVIDDALESELIKQRDTAAGGLDAAVRGAADVLTLSTADELAAGKTIFGGGTMEDNLRHERAIDKTDEQVNPRLHASAASLRRWGRSFPWVEAKNRNRTWVKSAQCTVRRLWCQLRQRGVKDRFVKGLAALVLALLWGYLGGKLVNKIGDGNPPPGGTPSDLMRDAGHRHQSVLPADVGGPVTRGLLPQQGRASCRISHCQDRGKGGYERCCPRSSGVSGIGNVLLIPSTRGELARKAANVYSRETGRPGTRSTPAPYDRIGDIKVDLPIARRRH